MSKNKNFKKNDQNNIEYQIKKSSYLLNNLRNFNGIFRKDVTYDNIKVTEKQDFNLSLKSELLEKPQGAPN